MKVRIRRGGEEEVAGGEGFELGEGESFVVGNAGVDDVEKGDFGVEGLEWLYGDGQTEAAFGTRPSDSFQDDVVVALAEPVGEEFLVFRGERGE